MCTLNITLVTIVHLQVTNKLLAMCSQQQQPFDCNRMCQTISLARIGQFGCQMS